MINLQVAQLASVSIHGIGVKNENEGINISTSGITLDDDVLKELLFKYFFKHFKEPEFYGFTFSNEDVTLNPMFNFASAIFKDPELLHNQSVFIAKHLYEQSSHPNIKPGDLMIAYIKDLVIDEQMQDAIGIFKSESKDAFLQFKHEAKQIKLGYEKGVNVEKLDKGCLILNNDVSDGYKVCIVDKGNKNNEAQYWKDDFLNLKAKNDDYHNTKNIINLTTSFIKDRLGPEFELEKFEQAGILNRSKEYFKRVERFEDEDYEDRIFFSNKEIIDEFKAYKEEYVEENKQVLDTQFFVSPNAYKKNARYLRSVIKLDKNFHIYVHGNHDLIEKQSDEKGKFYKIYYDAES